MFIRRLLLRTRDSIADGGRREGQDRNALACIEFVELVTEYLDGALEPGEMARADRHLDGCHGCSTYLEQFRATIQASGHMPPEPVPPEVADRLLAVYREFLSA
jgi:Putative zinc-finger